LLFYSFDVKVYLLWYVLLPSLKHHFSYQLNVDPFCWTEIFIW